MRSRFRLPIALVAISLLTGAKASAQAPSARERPMRFDVARDTWFSNVGAEADGNNGAAPRIKLKSNQEMALVDFDVASLKGKTVARATLMLRSAGEPRAKRVTVGTFGSEWFEGSGSGYAVLPGGSTHNRKRHPDLLWAGPGSDLCSVILGQGGTTWRNAEASAPDPDGWQAIAVDPIIVSARLAGVSEGFFLFDDTGTEWLRDGDKWTELPFPNRFFFSKEQNRSQAPYLLVTPGKNDRLPPGAVQALSGEPGDLPAGEAWVSWKTPSDRGEAGVIGFFVRVNGGDVPRSLIPLAKAAGETVKMRLRDLGLAPGKPAIVEVRAVDAAGNRGAWAKASVVVSNVVPQPIAGAARTEERANPSNLPTLAGLKVAVIDELDKVQPVTGEMIPPQPPEYRSANHLWSAATKTVRLTSARNETVGFQVLLEGTPARTSATIEFPAGSKVSGKLLRLEHVPSSKGPLPDPLVEGSHRESLAGAKSSSLYAELFVAADARPGKHSGKLRLKSGSAGLDLAIELEIFAFGLPDRLGFLPEMNCYGLGGDELAYYRLAHANRTVLNRLGYHHRGDVAEGCAPKWSGGKLDWSAWDKRFGPLFSGSAFADAPRKGVPIECFYLPLFENWPAPIEPNYNGSYWADQAFTKTYRDTFVKVSSDFAKHINNKGWHETIFQFYLNGKNDFKRGGWSHSTSPWLLDEPAHLQDFWALRWFGTAFHEGVDPFRGKAKLMFRADISRPQWQRDTLDGLLDYAVVGGAMRQYHRIVMDRKLEQNQMVIEYGSTNAIEDSNAQPVAWSIDAWSLGADGVLPWQTIGTAESWTKADALSLFYPPRPGIDKGPVPSLRLKAYRRGQQDVEYLIAYARATKQPRWAVGEAVRSELRLAGRRQGTGAGGEDAGVIHYGALTPQHLAQLRARIGRALATP